MASVLPAQAADVTIKPAKAFVANVEWAVPGISWISPMARALLKARAGEVVTLRTPGGDEALEILDVSYPPID